MNCIKIDLPGKSIFRDYCQENKTFSLKENQFYGKTYFYENSSQHSERQQDQNEVGDGSDDQDDGGKRLEEYVEPVLDDSGEDVVAHVDVFGEAVDYPAEGRGVKVGHRRTQNTL